MAVLQWDAVGERDYTVGIKEVVLFKSNSSKANGYDDGVAWNGVTKVSDSPEGAEATDLWANDSKYGSLRSAEQFKGTIEAYTSPEEFDECDGCAAIGDGVLMHQQNRKPFGLAYTETVGNDTDGMDHGKILHLVYNATASPTSKDHETVNDSPNVNPLSWEFDTTPVSVTGYKPTSHLEFHSNRMSQAAWNTLIGMIHGTSNSEPTLPTIETVLSTFGTSYTYTALSTEPADWETAYYTKYYTKYGTTYSLIPRQDTAPTFVASQYYKRDAET